MSDGIVQATTCPLQRKFGDGSIDRAREAEGAFRHQRLVWVGQHGPTHRSKFIDLPQRSRISASYAAAPERSDDFPSNPLSVSCGGTWAFWIH
jgi:hypothetical protein